MTQRILIFTALLASVICLLAYALLRSPQPVSEPPVPSSVQATPIPLNVESALQSALPGRLLDPKIVVLKSAHRMELYSKGTRLRSYPVGLGQNPIGPKRRQWDLCTPEGSYTVCAKNPHSKYYLALVLDYPNEHDARLGLRDGLISKAQYAEIAASIGSGACPSRNTPLGGDIVIHGKGSGADWTAGCVALDDENMRELFDAIPVGTPVDIQP